MVSGRAGGGSKHGRHRHRKRSASPVQAVGLSDAAVVVVPTPGQWFQGMQQSGYLDTLLVVT